MTKLTIIKILVYILAFSAIAWGTNDIDSKNTLGKPDEDASLFGKTPPDTISKENLQFGREIGEYKVLIYRNLRTWNHSVLQIFRNSVVVFSDENYYFDVVENGGYSVEPEDVVVENITKAGSDINGDGEPDLVVYSWTGGAHGAHGCYVFSIGSGFRVIYSSKGDVGSWSRFEDVNKDGQLEFIAVDKNFEYWNAGYANSPFVEVILEYKDGAYRFAVDFMKKPPPTPAEFNKIVNKTKKVIIEDLNRDQWVYWKDGNFILPWEGPVNMLEYIYSGNAQVAWDFFNRIWPEGKPGKEKYLQGFKEQLAESDYWEEMREAYHYDEIERST